jgi:hypothetical protein
MPIRAGCCRSSAVSATSPSRRSAQSGSSIATPAFRSQRNSPTSSPSTRGQPDPKKDKSRVSGRHRARLLKTAPLRQRRRRATEPLRSARRLRDRPCRRGGHIARLSKGNRAQAAIGTAELPLRPTRPRRRVSLLRIARGHPPGTPARRRAGQGSPPAPDHGANCVRHRRAGRTTTVARFDRCHCGNGPAGLGLRCSD